MEVVSEILTTTWISELSGLNYHFVSRCIKHTVVNGKQQYFREEHISVLNNMIEKAVEQILSIKLDPDNCFETLKVWTKKVKPVYLVEKQMGKTLGWKRIHFSDKGEDKYYGKFTERDLLDFQFAYREVAAKLESIRLVPDVK